MPANARDPQEMNECDLAATFPKYFVGERCYDDLTREIVTIERIEIDEHGNMGVYVSSEYLEGGRFPWELSSLKAVSRG